VTALGPDPLTTQLVELFCQDAYPTGIPAAKTADELVAEFRGWLRSNMREPTLLNVLGVGPDEPAGAPVPDLYA
jgi:hypothetical protein